MNRSRAESKQGLPGVVRRTVVEREQREQTVGDAFAELRGSARRGATGCSCRSARIARIHSPRVWLLTIELADGTSSITNRISELGAGR